MAQEQHLPSPCERYRFGYHTLGPIFYAFARLLLADAESHGLVRLAFVARDGEFLRTVTKKLLAVTESKAAPMLDYVYLSRMSTSLVEPDRSGDRWLAEARSVRAGTLDVASVLAYFGLSASDFADDLKRHGLHPDTPVNDDASLRRLLVDKTFAANARFEKQRQRELLRAYLKSHDIFGNPQCALVDIGWRGSTAKALASMFAEDPDYRPLRTYYLGYWHEQDCLHADNAIPVGLLADKRRQRNVLEGAAYYVSLLLEAICRADHGTVQEYRQVPGSEVEPVLAEDSAQRKAERANETWRRPIRDGILDAVGAHAARAKDSFPTGKLRRTAQAQLLRLAFFPYRWELDAVRGLVHTEGHVKEWYRPLVDPEQPSPILSPRRWLAGLASPWRFGYVAATGGYPLSAAFMLLESILLALPLQVRNALRDTVIRSSRR